MKNVFLLILLTISVQFSYAQIKVSNSPAAVNPDHDLDIAGSLTVRNKIYVGGSDVALGNPGRSGQVLVSQGPDLPPRWRTLNIPSVEAGFFYLIYNNAFTDFTNDNTQNEGININNADGANGGNGPYTIGMARNNAAFINFTTITGLTRTFDVFSTDNQVYITFEAVAHSNSNSADAGADFVCGIFAGGNTQATRTLRGIRKLSLQQSYGAGSNPFITYTQIALASGLGIGSHQVEVACKRTGTYGTLTDLSIGRSVSTNINEFVAKSSLKVEVYEAPQNFNDIVQ